MRENHKAPVKNLEKILNVPFLGGILTEYVGWPSIFLINLPIGLLGILLVQQFIPETTEKRVKLDYGGMVTFIIAAFSLVQGILTLFKGEIVGGILIVIALACVFYAVFWIVDKMDKGIE